MQVMAGAKVGGIETFYFDAVTALAEAGVEQHAVVRPFMHKGLEMLRRHDIPHAATHFSHLWPWPTHAVLREAVRTFQPDIVQYWTGAAASMAPKTQVPQVGWYGGYRRKKDFRSCTHFIGITPDLVRYQREQGASDSRVALIHIFAEPQSATPVDRATVGTPPDVPLLLALARLHKDKALDILLTALAEVPDAHLWIAGEGPERARLEAQTARLRLQDRVRFLGWRRDREALLAAADICVFPSREEPFGAVTIEAWAAQTPLIAAAAKGPAAYVVTGENGMLVPIDDSPALASAIRSVIDDDALRARIVAGGMQSYSEGFTKDVFIRKTIAFYEEILRR